MEQRRDIYLTFKGAVNNAVKYSDCHFIRLERHFDKHNLRMQISDDGNGFNLNHPKFGNGLTKMQKRAAAHGGSCSIQFKEGAGTATELIFPVKS